MLKQRTLIGRVTAETSTQIEAGLVTRYAAATGLRDALSLEKRAQTAAGLPAALVPHVALAYLGDMQSALDALKLAPEKVLHSRESTAVFQDVCVGDTLKITTSIHDLYEQQHGGTPMGMLTVQVVGERKKNDVLFICQRVYAVRGGFPRR